VRSTYAGGFPEGPKSLIVATASVDGEPAATRAWGLGLLEEHNTGSAMSFRLLLDANDLPTIENLVTTRAIAVTACNVRTFESVQIKGVAETVEPATEDDRILVRLHCDQFFTAVEQTDGTPRPLLERLVPAEYVACLVKAGAVFDQTPGPGAGAPVGA
jgi:Pyridoxamine 5'-phosphate oxidase